MIGIANAPVSFGVFELTEGAAGLPDPDALADAVASAGYDGIDLGPIGYLGRDGLTARLQHRGLSLAGGWVAMRFTDPRGFEADLARLHEALDLFEAAAGIDPDRAPRPTLADAGSKERRQNPGRGADVPGIGLDDEGWKALADNVGRAAEACRERGLEPTFHHHACTYVEAEQEIERLLDLTEVGLCLDSGHLLLGGGDPLGALKRWGDRINHVHVKDCRLDVLNRVIDGGEGMEAVWRRGAFCELGSGDVDIDAFLSGIRSLGYSGWIVVEQDTMGSAGVQFEDMAAAQARNRAYLHARGL